MASTTYKLPEIPAFIKTALLKSLEKTEKIEENYYADPKGIPTIGIGDAAVVKSGGQWVVDPGWVARLQGAGVVLTQDQIAAYNKAFASAAENLNNDNLSTQDRINNNDALLKAFEDNKWGQAEFIYGFLPSLSVKFNYFKPKKT
ncbi:MAG: hypothetical protein AB7E49_03710 [Campylobacterales bacterium]